MVRWTCGVGSLLLVGVFAACGVEVAASDSSDRAVARAQSAVVQRSVPPPPVRQPRVEAASRSRRPSFEAPEHVRAVYVNAWAAGSAQRIEELIALARQTEVNAFVIDVKDPSGFVSHATGLEFARSVGADADLRVRDRDHPDDRQRDQAPQHEHTLSAPVGPCWADRGHP